jgi:accessory gene regulator protein AgrB
MEEFGLAIIAHLLSAFTITIAVDIFFILIILFTEVTFSRLLGRRVRYGR